jgi:crotonobetainyl-CoA:carnitine CoA-transferase CaiB-like acyl-CoA transferase
MENITFEEFMLEMRNEKLMQKAFKTYFGDNKFRSHREEGRNKLIFTFRMKSELFAEIVYSLVNGADFVTKNTTEVASTQETLNQQEHSKTEEDLL